MLTETQQKIAAHFRDGQFNSSVDIDKQLSIWNESCLVGMLETGEATLDDMQTVGGDALAGRLAKKAIIA